MALADINCQHHGKLVSATLQESVPSLVSLQMDGSSIGSARNSHFWSPSWFSQPSYSLLSSRRMLVSSQQVKCYVACLGECSLLLHRHMHLKFFHSRCECISHLIPTCKFLILGQRFGTDPFQVLYHRSTDCCGSLGRACQPAHPMELPHTICSPSKCSFTLLSKGSSPFIDKLSSH